MGTLHHFSRPRAASQPAAGATGRRPARVSFNRQELGQILNVYSRNVMRGEWKDYAIDHGDSMALFSIFNGQHNHPVFAVAKLGGKSKRRGFAVYAGSKKLRQGVELADVLSVFDRKLKLVVSRQG